LVTGRSAPPGEPPLTDAAALRSRTTLLLEQAESQPLPALDDLVPLVFDELREIARRQLAREHRNATLQTTALVHEAWLKLVGDAKVTARGRAYFFAAAARAMRQVLVDAARSRSAGKRDGGIQLSSLTGYDGEAVDTLGAELLDLDGALEALGRAHPRHMRVVECRFFGGMSVEETAAALGVSERTVKADWALARAWLHRALHGDGGE
jgi:RNA polymerase sigma factor (TIGR02999 family)